MVKFSANQRADTVISQPMRFSVPPVSVKILRTGSGLVVGQPRTVECEVRGARPNHRVSWWKNGARLSFSQTESSPDGGTLVSSIVIVPEMTDSEATLQCRAETPGLAEVREHKWQLPVQCEYLTGLSTGQILSSHLHRHITTYTIHLYGKDLLTILLTNTMPMPLTSPKREPSTRSFSSGKIQYRCLSLHL